MPSRPVSQPFLLSTSTGNFGPAYFGTLHHYAAMEYDGTGSTAAIKGSVQRSMGGSGIWTDVITLTSGTVGSIQVASTSTGPFDKLRVNLTANELSSTDTPRYIWLGAGPI